MPQAPLTQSLLDVLLEPEQVVLFSQPILALRQDKMPMVSTTLPLVLMQAKPSMAHIISPLGTKQEITQ